MDAKKLFDYLSDKEKQDLFECSVSWKIGKPFFSTHLTNISDWAKNNKLSVKLTNVLFVDYYTNKAYSRDELPFKFVELVNKHDFLLLRSAGKKTWEEFIKLRGY